MIPKLSASFTRPSDATAYTAGDLIGNSLTANQVVPMRFGLQGDLRGARVCGARCVIKPASGNLVITACDFDLLLFRAGSNIPFADAGYPADNAALTLTEVMCREMVAVLPFVNGAWRNQLGALVAGTFGWQSVMLAGRDGARFSLDGIGSAGLVGLLQAKAAWTPGAVAQAINIELEVEA